MTPLQTEILKAIKEYTALHGYPPNYRVLADIVDRSPESVVQVIRALKEKEVLRKAPAFIGGAYEVIHS